MSVSVQREDFDPGQEIARLSAVDFGAVGGVASFVGLVRSTEGPDAIRAMTLEHYPGMTERQLAGIEAAARDRWPLLDVRIVHRFGRLEAGERIVFAGVAGTHRAAAFAACMFLVDWLKTSAPFWKCEHRPDGDRWVDAKASDDEAAARWRADGGSR